MRHALQSDLAEKWAMIRSARRVVTSALEVQRSEKVIGASLEAAPSVTISDPAMLAALQSVPFEDICITSALQLTTGQIEHGQFTLADHPGIGVAFSGEDFLPNSGISRFEPSAPC